MKSELINIAHAYSKTKLWKKLWDDDVFALKLDDGEMGYISVMGGLGEHYAVAIFRGEHAFQSFLRILHSDRLGLISPFEELEQATSQDCLQLSFLNDFELEKDELEEVKKALGRKKVRLGGELYYPAFRKFRLHRLPVPVTDPGELYVIKQAVEAALYLSSLTYDELHPFITESELEPGDTRPILVKDGDGFQIKGSITVPEIEVKYERVISSQSFLMGQIKYSLNKGLQQDLQCDLVQLPDPVMVEGDPEPIFSHCLFCVDASTGMVIPPAITTEFLERPEDILNKFLKRLLDQKIRPRSIVVPDERTYHLLVDSCEKIGIAIKQGPTDELDEFEMQFLSDRGEDQLEDEMEEFIHFFLHAQNEELVTMPDELLEQLELIIATGAFASDIEDRLKKQITRVKKLKRS